VSDSRRLDDRIRELSQELLRAEGEEFQRIAAELRSTISEQVERIRATSLEHGRRSPDKS